MSVDHKLKNDNNPNNRNNLFTALYNNYYIGVIILYNNC